MIPNLLLILHTPLNTSKSLPTKIATLLIELTQHVRKNIMDAKTDFDNFIREHAPIQLQKITRIKEVTEVRKFLNILDREPDFSSSESTSSISSNSSFNKVYSSPTRKPKTMQNKTNKTIQRLSSDKLCKQALNMIFFLASLQTKKLDLKHELRQRRIAFLEWIGQLEIAFSSNQYTKNILKDYSTKNKVHKTDDEQIDTCPTPSRTNQSESVQ